MSAEAGVGALREALLAARQRNDRDAVPGLVDGVRALAARGYRCCLADFDAFRAAYYVRLLGFEAGRVTAELEFPIDPSVDSVQRLPLSHLVDYVEAEPERIRRIYQGLAPYLHQRRPPLVAAPQQRVGILGGERRRRPSPTARGTAIWWTIAVLLFVSSLILLVVA